MDDMFDDFMDDIEMICEEIKYEGKTYSMYKERETDKVYWIDNIGTFGEHLFTFDGVNVYNLFSDYPHNLSKEEKEIFDKENPFWSDFFKDRT